MAALSQNRRKRIQGAVFLAASFWLCGVSSAGAQTAETTTTTPTTPSSLFINVAVRNNVLQDGDGDKTAVQEPLADVKVVAQRDGQRFESVTGTDGKAQILVPSPGSYSVSFDRATLPAGVDVVGGSDSERVVSVTSVRSPPVAFDFGASQGDGSGVSLKKLLQATVQGLRFGLIIGITAIGLSLIFGVTGLTNFAHGELVTAGALFAFWLNNGAGLPLLVAAPIAIALGGLFGALHDIAIFRPLRRRGTSLIAQLVITIGLSLVIKYIILMLFEGRPRNYNDFQGTQPLSWVPLVNINGVDLAVMVISVGLLTAVGLFLQRTRMGKALRAVADNRDLASSSGIDVQRIITMVWAVSGALAAIGGILLALSDGLEWQSGARLLLLMFAGVTLGGLGTAYGALIGSLMVGVLVEVSTLFMPSELKTVVALVVLILVLVVRPQGLLGQRMRVG
jgi:neutral amino acid transport system permease protein